MSAEPLFTYKISSDDGTEWTQHVYPRDVLHVEKTYKGLTLDVLTREISYQNIYLVTYWAARRQGKIPTDMGQATFDEKYDIEPIPYEPSDPSRPDLSVTS